MAAVDPSVEGENLALCPGARITASEMHPRGGGARDPRVLLNETALRLHGKPLSDFGFENTYDTFCGPQKVDGPDWYAIEWPEPVVCNCIEMTMGYAYPDGGWWTSLEVEYRAEDGDAWRPVENLVILPPYRFEDTRSGRRPFETYALLFNEVAARAVRLIGQPGGSARHTSLGRLAVYRRDLLRWNMACLPDPPIPYFFQLISPKKIWQFSRGFAKLTGVVLNVRGLEHYLDEETYQEYWRWTHNCYEGRPSLEKLVGDSVGWGGAWVQLASPFIVRRLSPATWSPYVCLMFHHTLTMAVAPVVIEGQLLGNVETRPAILVDDVDWEWHRQFAGEVGIPWDAYRAAVEQSPHMTLEQMEGFMELLAGTASTIAELAHRNLRLEQEAATLTEPERAQRKQIVRRAIEFMQQNLETEIGVVEVARAVAVSPSYLYVLFMEQVGCNPSDFLINLRLERAKEYLGCAGISVMDVAVALGYSPSYFTRLFKQRVGCTPGQYARRASAR